MSRKHSQRELTDEEQYAIEAFIIEPLDLALSTTYHKVKRFKHRDDYREWVREIRNAIDDYKHTHGLYTEFYDVVIDKINWDVTEEDDEEPNVSKLIKEGVELYLHHMKSKKPETGDNSEY